MVTNRVFPDREAPAAQPETAARERAAARGALNEELSGSAGRWMRRVEDTLANRPQLALGVAVAVGVLAGWLIKRR